MYRRGRENPSFSSSLLDEIYRSIDQPGDEKEKSFYAKKDTCFENEYECEKVLIRRRSLVVDVKRSINFTSSSSSGSSCGGGFSSSETESVYGLSRPKPIRTTTKHSNSHRYELEDLQPKKHESKFVKTKSRAMKIYGDLKKAKQPISPGGRLASFLNSIFTSNNAKNTKSVPRNYDHHNHMKSKSVNASTCSSASSFSRSCLSKTPSSRGSKLTNSSTNKSRSVRFVIVEDDIDHSHNSEKIAREKTRKIEEAARNLIKNYQKKVECFENYVTSNVKDHNEIEMRYDDDDDEDDDVSNASSDLFELENFAVIGNEKYGDELPVYGTTRIDMNIM